MALYEAIIKCSDFRFCNQLLFLLVQAFEHVLIYVSMMGLFFPIIDYKYNMVFQLRCIIEK